MKIQLFNSFNDFFNNSYSTMSYINTQIPLTSTGNFYIVFSFFNIFSNRAIYLTTSESFKIVIENSLFSKCNHNFGSGGAIYLVCSNGEIIINKVCVYSCTVGSTYNYGYFIHSESGNLLKHQFLLNSITSCKIESPSTDQSSMYSLRNGLIIQKNNNISNCKSRSYTFSLIWSSPLSNYSFINLINLIASSNVIIESQRVLFFGNYFNIINHTQGTVNGHVFSHYYSHYSKFNYFLIINSTISNSYNLFYFVDCQPFQLFNCWINIGSYSNVIVNSPISSNINTFQFNYFSTIFCDTFEYYIYSEEKYVINNSFKFFLLWVIY